MGTLLQGIGTRQVIFFLGICLAGFVLTGCEENRGSGLGDDDAGHSFIEKDAETGKTDTGLVAGDCEPVLADPSGNEQLLKPGCYVVGIDGFRVWATDGTLEEPIWVSIERVGYPTGVKPLPEELTHAGFAYRVKSRKEMSIDGFLFFELPRVDDTDESELAGALLFPAKYNEYSVDNRDEWQPMDGYISEDGERLMIDVYHLLEEGWVITLAHGKYFSHFPPEEDDD